MAMIATIIPSTIVPLAEDPPTCTLVGNSVTVGQEFLLSSAMMYYYGKQWSQFVL